MKGATQCARRLTELFRSLRSKLGKVGRPPTSDPTTQLILGIFSRDLPESKAREALDAMRGMVVDYNELRVIVPVELAEHLGGEYPDVYTKCEDLSRALNKIFAGEHTTALDRLLEKSKADAKTYLDRIDGLEAYTRARVRLLGLQHHAVPLDEAMWAYARKAGIVAPDCALEEAQQFLERHIDEEDVLEFVALLKKQAWTEMGAAVRRGEVERIRSVPPNRASKNMLRPIVQQASAVGTGLEDGENLEFAEPETPAVETDGKAKTTARRASAKVGGAAGNGTSGGKSGARAGRTEARPKTAAKAARPPAMRPNKPRAEASGARSAKRARKVSSGGK